jgi:signal transduction histidine kinase
MADGMVRFWIQDNGAGLTLEQQARLFTPFVQLRQMPRNGHGLGLSIVYRIINKKLGGYVGVESTGMPGQGSRFYFVLPGADDTEDGSGTNQR